MYTSALILRQNLPDNLCYGDLSVWLSRKPNEALSQKQRFYLIWGFIFSSSGPSQETPIPQYHHLQAVGSKYCSMEVMLVKNPFLLYTYVCVGECSKTLVAVVHIRAKVQ